MCWCVVAWGFIGSLDQSEPPDSAPLDELDCIDALVVIEVGTRSYAPCQRHATDHSHQIYSQKGWDLPAAACHTD